MVRKNFKIKNMSKINEDNNVVDMERYLQLQNKVLALKSQQLNIQKQIEDLQTQQNNLTPGSNNDSSINVDTNQQNVQNNNNQNVTTNITPIIGESGMDVNFNNTTQITSTQQNTVNPNSNEKNYENVIYVSFKSGNNTVIGKVYRDDENSDWSTSCMNDNCETFQEMSFVKTLGHYGVLDKLENFYNDVVELSENEYNNLISKYNESLSIMADELLTENFMFGNDISDINFDVTFESLYISGKNELISLPINV